MSDATQTAAVSDTQPVTAKRTHAWVWVFLGVVFLICAGASGAVYLEHRFGQFATAMQQAKAAHEREAQPTTTALRMLSSLQTRMKAVDTALETTTETLNTHTEELASLSEKPEPDTAAIDALKAELATTKDALESLQETVKKQAVPSAAYGDALRQFLQVKQHLGTKRTQDDLDAFKKALDAIAIDPKQLALRASIAENIGHIEAALTQGLTPRATLMAELSTASQSMQPPKPKATPKTEETAAEETGMWARLKDFSKHHVRIEPEANAAARDALAALEDFETRDDILGAARTISALDNAPEPLRAWQSSAKNTLAAERALSRIEDDLTKLTQAD